MQQVLDFAADNPYLPMIAVYGFAAVFFLYFLIVAVVRREIRREMKYQVMAKPKPARERNGRFRKREV